MGMRAVSATSVDRGDLVDVVGSLATSPCGERHIDQALIIPRSSGSTLPKPLLMNLRSLGGSAAGLYTKPIGCGLGARNAGLLVRVVATVLAADQAAFWMIDSSVETPVKVTCPAGAAPAVGSIVSVTGISAIECQATDALPVIRARDAADLFVIRPPL
jgi:hypothetical protein